MRRTVLEADGSLRVVTFGELKPNDRFLERRRRWYYSREEFPLATPEDILESIARNFEAIEATIYQIQADLLTIIGPRKEDDIIQHDKLPICTIRILNTQAEHASRCSDQCRMMMLTAPHVITRSVQTSKFNRFLLLAARQGLFLSDIIIAWRIEHNTKNGHCVLIASLFDGPCPRDDSEASVSLCLQEIPEDIFREQIIELVGIEICFALKILEQFREEWKSPIISDIEDHCHQWANEMLRIGNQSPMVIDVRERFVKKLRERRYPYRDTSWGDNSDCCPTRESPEAEDPARDEDF